ncbi:NAD(P)H-quinone oxidoreductase [Sphaerisporangium perillae]|uniref:NAD(P)H-quinone oxidoreductase n=1 Tax=Sphaerisporangium perillae TaxID=2935860 RepID=UPI00200E0BEC|nr:NAD(P)H-quinone oxidoreductase [Sphaerisporangium perillae]
MKAIVADGNGGPEVLSLHEVPDPMIGSDEVLIEVKATAVNRADTSQRKGLYDPPPGASPYLGLECSGTIAAIGDKVSGWSVGDQVCALLGGGGYAEKVAVPAGQLLTIPDNVDLVEAAALPEVACTVWSNLFGPYGLRPGESVLIHGGGSGIGTMAIQMARAWGARVACTASTTDKLERCRELGAQILINHREEDFVAAIRQATDERGVDVVLDIVGAAYLHRNLEVLAEHGRLHVIGLQSGTDARLDLGMLLRKRAIVTGTTLRSRAPEDKARIVAEVQARVWPLIASGAVHPVVDRILPLEKAAEAHRLLEQSTNVGKVVLTVG